jgi:uncharacterized cupin superfamily protein
MADTNIWSDDWGEQGEDWSGGGGTGKRLVADGPKLGMSLYELGPGNFNVLHYHHGAEELLVVLRGRPTLRTFGEERQLEEGEVVHFPPGPDGVHGIRNDTDEPARYLVAGIRVVPEVVEYPELRQIAAQAPTGSMTGERLWFIHDVEEEA